MPRARSVRAAELALVVLALAACDRRSAPEVSADAAPSSAPPPQAAEPAPPPSVAPFPHREPDASALAPCRLGMTEGIRPPIDLGAWVTLGAGESFMARFPSHGRELLFAGPGRVLACGPATAWDDVDVPLVAGGKVTLASAVAAASPGSEVWIGTPCGAVRAVASRLSVVVSERACTVTQQGGTAFVAAASDVTSTPDTSLPDAGRDADGGARGDAVPERDGWWRLDGRVELRLEAQTAFTSAAAKKASDHACADATAREREIASRLAGDAGPGEIGDLTAQHLESRRRARAACATARTRGR